MMLASAQTWMESRYYVFEFAAFEIHVWQCAYRMCIYAPHFNANHVYRQRWRIRLCDEATMKTMMEQQRPKHCLYIDHRHHSARLKLGYVCYSIKTIQYEWNVLIWLCDSWVLAQALWKILSREQIYICTTTTIVDKKEPHYKMKWVIEKAPNKFKSFWLFFACCFDFLVFSIGMSFRQTSKWRT